MTFNRTHYFVDKGTPRGLAYESLRLFEDEMNAGKKNDQKVHLVFVPLLGVAGLALSIGLGALINAGLLLWGLRKIGSYQPLQGWTAFMLRVGATGLRSRTVGVIALALLSLAMSGTSLLAASIAATLVLVAVAASDRGPTVPLADAFAAAAFLR